MSSSVQSRHMILLSVFCFCFYFETNHLKEQQEQELNESEKEHSANMAALKSEHEEILRGTIYC